jgi:hypothetical protein
MQSLCWGRALQPPSSVRGLRGWTKT